MTNYETFVLTIGCIAFILFILAVVGLAVYYLIKLFGWLDGKLFKKGNK
jgi:hypothetical protein